MVSIKLYGFGQNSAKLLDMKDYSQNKVEIEPSELESWLLKGGKTSGSHANVQIKFFSSQKINKLINFKVDITASKSAVSCIKHILTVSFLLFLA